MTWEGTLDVYPDAEDVSDYAAEAMKWCAAKGIINGDQGRLNPQGSATRAEGAAMISRFTNLYR